MKLLQSKLRQLQRLPNPILLFQDVPIYKLRADFVVPEGPAFKLVSVDQASILRPSSIRELSLSAAGFTGNNGVIAPPTQLGIEAAPFLLLKGRELTRKVAIGIRGTLLDRADVRLDDTLAQRVLENLRTQHAIYTAAATRTNPFNSPNTSTYEIPVSPQEQARVDSLDRALGKIIAQREEEQWNATALDFAAAASGASPDAEGKAIRFQAASAWTTWALRAGQHGQFLLGARAASRRDSATDNLRRSVSASTRLYFGTHAYKAFIEAELGA